MGDFFGSSFDRVFAFTVRPATAITRTAPSESVGLTSRGAKGTQTKPFLLPNLFTCCSDSFDHAALFCYSTFRRLVLSLARSKWQTFFFGVFAEIQN
jgi:hypothetical protein